MPASLIDGLIADTTQEAELLVIEGAMGLFDGVPGTPGRSGAITVRCGSVESMRSKTPRMSSLIGFPSPWMVS